MPLTDEERTEMAIVFAALNTPGRLRRWAVVAQNGGQKRLSSPLGNPAEGTYFR
jgi:hypothetical protein